mgnify:CR=1 FL=1
MAKQADGAVTAMTGDDSVRPYPSVTIAFGKTTASSSKRTSLAWLIYLLYN